MQAGWRASRASSTGVLPRLTTCLGPRTAFAGLRCRWWRARRTASGSPPSAASGSARIAVARVLRLGSNVNQRDSGDRGQLPILEAAAEIANCPGIGAPGVRVADLCCENSKK